MVYSRRTSLRFGILGGLETMSGVIVTRQNILPVTLCQRLCELIDPCRSRWGKSFVYLPLTKYKDNLILWKCPLENVKHLKEIILYIHL